MKSYIILFITTLSLSSFAIETFKESECEQGGDCITKTYILEKRDIENKYKTKSNKREYGSALRGVVSSPASSYSYSTTSRKDELKLEELRSGMCLLKTFEGREPEYYKITEINKSSKKIYMVKEIESREYSLKKDFYFFNSRKFDRTLLPIDCNRTPNLAKDSYIQNCIKNDIGTFYCEAERISNY